MNMLFPIAVIVMGFSGLVAQIILLRELLVVFSGNELCIGIILAHALILEAFGSYVLGSRAESARHKLESFTLITMLFCVVLLVSILATRVLRNMMGVSIGESIGLVPMFWASFLVLVPVSILHGALFTWGCRIWATFSNRGAASVGTVYVWETVGSIIGGVICAYLLIPTLSSIEAAVWLGLLNGIICLALLAPYRDVDRYRGAVLACVGVLILTAGFLLVSGQAERLHDRSISWQWKNQDIVHYQNSRYGNICVTENQGQYVFFLDGVVSLITPVPDIPFVEKFVHIPLLAHADPAAVLILSGGAGGVVNEVLKHPAIAAVEYAELDPLVLDLIRKFPTPLTETELNDPRVSVRHIDGRLLLKTSASAYDVIFVGLDEPANLQSNRFFTREFFTLAQQRLNEGGILVIGLPGSLDFLSEELVDLNSSIYHTLKRVFPHIRVIPGDGTNLFLASEGAEILAFGRDQVAARLNERGIGSEAGIPWHIQNKLHPGWQRWFAQFLDGGTEKINTDFRPLGLFYSVSYWNALLTPSMRGVFQYIERLELWKLVAPVVVLLLLYLLFLRKRRFMGQAISLCIITTGFAGMIFDLMLIFTFQAVYGYVFSWIGILVACFMAGAASGAFLATTVMARLRNCLKLFVTSELALICFSFSFPVVFMGLYTSLDTSGLILFKALILVISFISGFLTGAQFPLANELYLEHSSNLSRTAGLLYGSDLLGGWFGGIAGAVVLLPILGLAGTCIFVGVLKLTSFAVVVTQSSRQQTGG